MAKNKTAAANTALMGAALLSAIAAGAVDRVTEAQAASLDPAHYEVNTADVVDGAAAVRLTEAGQAAAQASQGEQPAAEAASSSAIEIDDDVAMPDNINRRSPRETLYPFDKLQVGQSFHVAKTDDNPEPHIRLSSSVSGAHTRFSPVLKDAQGNPVMENYEIPTYQRGDDGKYVKDDEGKRITTGKETRTREKRGDPERVFKIVQVDASDKRGEGARVFRVK